MTVPQARSNDIDGMRQLIRALLQAVAAPQPKMVTRVTKVSRLRRLLDVGATRIVPLS
jgi:hypothetical protein